MTWLAQARDELAVERILDAAATLFAEHGLDGPGMEEVARAAGCSRATLYRHVPNRRALQVAFARREAQRILAAVTDRVRALSGDERTAEAVLACLDEVRSRPHLARWYAATGTPVLAEVLRDSGVVDALAADGADPDRVRWLLRIVLSFLSDPAGPAEERRLVRRFVGAMPAEPG